MVPPTQHPGQGIFGNTLLVTLIALLLIAIIVLIVVGIILIRKARKNVIILTPDKTEGLSKLWLASPERDSEKEKSKKYTVEKIKKEILETEKITDLKLLDQKIIIRILEQNGGSALQKDLTNLSGFSKPKLSRIINSLEKRGVIQRQPVGQTFLVKLK